MNKMHTLRRLLSALRVAGLCAALCCAVSVASAAPPNIVLILADDLGVNDLACYGRAEHRTPHLDRLASEGVRFSAAYCAQPICSPSRAAILTGKHPARLHLTTFLPGRADAASQKLLHPKIAPQLPLAEVTLAESLRAAGYRTGCFGKWHLGGGGFGPKEQGFDEVFPGRANTKPSATEGGKGEFELTAAACDFIRAHRERPFFLYLPHNNPHIPLAAQEERVARFADTYNPLYAAVIETLDDAVGRVLKTLDELDLAANTLVVFTSDNGGLHVRELNDLPPTHNTPYRAGKGYLYEGGLRVPLVARLPGKIKPRVSDQPVVNTDLPPTLLAFAGAKLPTGLDGRDCSAEWQGSEAAPRTFFWHFPHYTNQGSRPAGAVRASDREGDWKLVEQYEDGSLELYDLRRDPGEEANLAALQPERATALRDRLHAWRKDIGAQENAPNPQFDAEQHRALYRDFDAARLKPAQTAAESAAGQRDWRQTLDAAVRQKK